MSVVFANNSGLPKLIEVRLRGGIGTLTVPDTNYLEALPREFGGPLGRFIPGSAQRPSLTPVARGDQILTSSASFLRAGILCH
jgi:hypothetical protein